MVSIVNDITVRYVGLSTDEKPTDGVENGASLYLMDKGYSCYFDAESGEWVAPEEG